MIHVTFYHNNSDSKTVMKQLTRTWGTFEGDFKTPCNILKPTIRIVGFEESPIISTMGLGVKNNANYCYIEELGRYYYVGEPTILTNTIVEYPLTCDVLMSHAEGIYNTEALIERQENEYNVMINDSELPLSSKKFVKYKKFSGSFNISPTYILTVSGKGN